MSAEPARKRLGAPTEAARDALALLVRELPPGDREAARRCMMHTIRSVCREHGHREPDWIADLIDG